MGGRGANSGIPVSHPSGGGAGGGSGEPMDMMPGAPKTLKEAIGNKGRPMAVRDAVMKANPFYDPTMSTEEYNANCQRAVIATEARFRGYDVIAQPTYEGDTMPSGNNWATNFQGTNIERVGRTTGNAAKKAVEQKMQEYGDGSRAVMVMGWKSGRTGHVLNVVQRAGNTYYYDGQSGTIVSPKSLYNAIKPKTVQIARVDNLPLSEEAKNAVRTTPKRRKK